MPSAFVPLYGLGLAVVAQAASPVFPNDFTSEETIDEVIYQGSIVQQDNAFCCGSNSNCEIQLQYIAGTRYFSYTQRKERFDDHVANQIIIDDHKNLVEVEVDSTGACISYCPLTTPMEPFDLIESDAVDMGPTTIGGKAVEEWQYVEKGPLNITMQTNVYYVDQSDPKSAVPVFEHDDLTPFKIHLGYSNNSWTSFTAGAIDPLKFNYTKGPKDGCPQASNCGQSDHLLRRYRMMRDRSVSFSKIMELRKSERAQLHRPRGASKNLLQKSTATPTFPQDFSADVTDFLIVPQGDYYTFESSGGFEYWCLKTNSNGKIQTEFQKAPNYVSYSTNQTRLGDPGASQAVIQDYNLGKEFKVDSNNTCQSYCPMQAGDTTMPSLSIDSSAKDLGTMTLGDGKSYQHYRWSDKIVKFIKMDTIDAFVDMTDSSNPVPYLWMERITPFGKYLASGNTTYDNFKGGKQPAEIFTVNNLKSCPLDSSCQPTSP